MQMAPDAPPTVMGLIAHQRKRRATTALMAAVGKR
jgi:hypothetical protein